MANSVGIALLGTGTVGGGVIELLNANHASIARHCGHAVHIAHACARDVNRARAKLDTAIKLSSDWRTVVADPACAIIVELIGGETDALGIAHAALAAGKPLVTANKALLATHGKALFASARQQNCPILFEAAVAGCIPIIQVLRHALAGDQVTSVLGIINGTCNHILSRMRATGMNFDAALTEAIELGYAEADPTLDIDGWDTAHKAVILSWLAFGAPLSMTGIEVGGVREAQPEDERMAALFGYIIKQVAQVRKHADGIEVSTSMALIANDAKLANVDGNLNAVLINSQACGEQLFIGAGAGAGPTGAAVVSNIIEAATGIATLPTIPHAKQLLATAELRRESYLRLRVNDEPGVTAKITAQLAAMQISIEALHQSESHAGKPTDLAMLLHEARWGEVRKVVAKLAKLTEVCATPVLLPIAITHQTNNA